MTPQESESSFLICRPLKLDLEVRQATEALVTLSSEQGFGTPLVLCTVLDGWARAERGELETGIIQIRQGIVALLARGFVLTVPQFHALLAEVYGKAGQTKEGLSSLSEAIIVVNETGQRNFEAELHRLKGELLLLQNESNAAQAEKSFCTAIEISRNQHAKSFGTAWARPAR